MSTTSSVLIREGCCAKRGNAELPVGAHLITPRDGFSHHGIHVGGGKVVHYSGFCRGLHRGPVEETTIEEFADGSTVWVARVSRGKYSGEEVARRARSRLGENRYRLFTNNCEHFCCWCLHGIGRSEQVRQCLRHPVLALEALSRLMKATIAQWAGAGVRRNDNTSTAS